MRIITSEIILRLIKGKELELKPTQTRICLPIINRIYKKLSAGIRFRSINVYNDLICDGHHRYLASILANYTLKRVPTIATSAIDVVLWESILFEEEDWDTPGKVKILNQQDAVYNNISVTEINDLLK